MTLPSTRSADPQGAERESRTAFPDEWDVAPLADIATIERGRFTHRPRNAPHLYGGPHAFIQTGDVAASLGKITKFNQTLTDEGLAVSRLFPAGTIVMTIAANIGDTAIATFPVAFPDSLVGIRPGTRIDAQFLEYVLRTRKRALSDAAPQNAQKNINLEVLRPLLIQVPPVSEQRKIAAILSAVDDVIEKTEAVIDELQVVKKSMLQELLTRGLLGRHTRFKMTEVGEVPETWEVTTLGSCAKRVTDGTHQSPTFTQAGVPFLLVKSISSGVVNWRDTNFVSVATYEALTKRCKAERGDVLYTAVGATYGVAVAVEVDWPFTFQRHIAHIKPDQSRLAPDYLTAFLNSPFGKRQADRAAVGNAQPTVTLGSLSKFLIPVPPRDEQARIAAAFNVVDHRLVVERDGLQAANELKQSLATVLLTGQIRVNIDQEVAA